MRSPAALLVAAALSGGLLLVPATPALATAAPTASASAPAVLLASGGESSDYPKPLKLKKIVKKILQHLREQHGNGDGNGCAPFC